MCVCVYKEKCERERPVTKSRLQQQQQQQIDRCVGRRERERIFGGEVERIYCTKEAAREWRVALVCIGGDK